jgi:hypothetical protein
MLFLNACAFDYLKENNRIIAKTGNRVRKGFMCVIEFLINSDENRIALP